MIFLKSDFIHFVTYSGDLSICIETSVQIHLQGKPVVLKYVKFQNVRR